MWRHNTEGAIYLCTRPGFALAIGHHGTNLHGGPPILFWADTAPAQVNPAVMAQEAVDRMVLVAPQVGATPLRTAEAKSVIGLPTWLWIAGADEHSWGPITATASSGGETVTATAQVDRVVWDMGDGHTVTCHNSGTEWTRGKGTTDSPTCGYRYTRPGHHTITATTYWNVDWSGAGQSGTITFDMSGTRELTVVELHALITG